jgi:hypothetical protein
LGATGEGTTTTGTKSSLKGRMDPRVEASGLIRFVNGLEDILFPRGIIAFPRGKFVLSSWSLSRLLRCDQVLGMHRKDTLAELIMQVYAESGEPPHLVPEKPFIPHNEVCIVWSVRKVRCD